MEVLAWCAHNGMNDTVVEIVNFFLVHLRNRNVKNRSKYYYNYICCTI